MKNREQVFDHLKKTGYTQLAITKIMGFLIGNGTKTANEGVCYKRGNGSFDDFLKWYHSEENRKSASDNCPICKMFECVFTALDLANEDENEDLVAELEELVDLMVDLFIVDETDNERV